jgi:hypothetical protein
LFSTRIGGNVNVYSNSSFTNAIGRWVHLCGVFDNAGLKLYLNSQLDSQVAFAGLVSRSYPETRAMISNDGTTATGGRFNGVLSDVRLYSRALSAAEISAIHRGLQ